MKPIYLGNKVNLLEDNDVYVIEFINPSSLAVTVTKEELFDVLEQEFDIREKKMKELFETNSSFKKRHINYEFDRSDIKNIKLLLGIE